MEQKTRIFQSIEHLNHQEKLKLFFVEELETRLEMAAVTDAAGESTDGSCQNVSCNSGCWA